MASLDWTLAYIALTLHFTLQRMYRNFPQLLLLLLQCFLLHLLSLLFVSIPRVLPLSTWYQSLLSSGNHYFNFCVIRDCYPLSLSLPIPFFLLVSSNGEPELCRFFNQLCKFLLPPSKRESKTRSCYSTAQ